MSIFMAWFRPNRTFLGHLDNFFHTQLEWKNNNFQTQNITTFTRVKLTGYGYTI